MTGSDIPAEWLPMLREAGIAAQSICGGLTALRRANYAEVEYYSYALFGLSIGLERLFKLTILVDRRAQGLSYPTNDELKNHYGHDLKSLYSAVEEIRHHYSDKLSWSLPDEHDAAAALEVLADFAKVTRYYNLDVITGRSGIHTIRDPIRAWYGDVGRRILSRPRSQRYIARAKANAKIVDTRRGPANFVRFIAEDGTPINTVYEAELRADLNELIQRESVVICACLARHAAEVLREAVYSAHDAEVDDVPCVDEFFAIFDNEASMFRRRRTFSIRG